MSDLIKTSILKMKHQKNATGTPIVSLTVINLAVQKLTIPVVFRMRTRDLSDPRLAARIVKILGDNLIRNTEVAHVLLHFTARRIGIFADPLQFQNDSSLHITGFGRSR